MTTIDPARFRGLELNPTHTAPRPDPLLDVIAMLVRRWEHLTKHEGYVGDTAARSLWYLTGPIAAALRGRREH